MRRAEASYGFDAVHTPVWPVSVHLQPGRSVSVSKHRKSCLANIGINPRSSSRQQTFIDSLVIVCSCEVHLHPLMMGALTRSSFPAARMSRDDVQILEKEEGAGKVVLEVWGNGLLRLGMHAVVVCRKDELGVGAFRFNSLKGTEDSLFSFSEPFFVPCSSSLLHKFFQSSSAPG